MMQLIGQRDPRWAKVTLGKSNSEMEDWGCAVACVSMLSDWYKCFRDPKYLAKHLDFLWDLLIWKSIERELCFKWVWRQYGYNEKRLLDSMNGLTTSCIIQISRKHWVVGIRKVGNKIYVADPWEPQRMWYSKYAVTGSSHFDIK